MSTTCQACQAKSTLYLCSRCTEELRETLEYLPQWISHVFDVALRRTRLGTGSKRTKSDEMPALYAPDTEQGKPTNQARATTLLDAVRNTITTWVRHIGETHGITFVRPTFIGPLLPGHVRLSTTPAGIEFLREHVAAIACDEAAGQCYHEIQDVVRQIDRLINRPAAMRFLGRCPTWIEHTRRACGTELRCRDGTIEVTCPACRRTHNADRLQLLMMNDLERKKLTIERILELNRTVIHEDFRISERTLRRWRKPGPHGELPKLRPRGYRRADGREVINRHSDEDEPLFLWSDVTRLRGEKPERKTGWQSARLSARPAKER